MIVLIVNNSDLNAITAQSKFQNMFQVQFIGKFQIKFQILKYVHLTPHKHLNNLIKFYIFTKCLWFPQYLKCLLTPEYTNM